MPLDVVDYDLRTPLHLAAAEGHLDVVRYFVVQDVDLNPPDRWGNTPLDDAIRHEGGAVADLLRTERSQVGNDLIPDRASRAAAKGRGRRWTPMPSFAPTATWSRSPTGC